MLNCRRTESWRAFTSLFDVSCTQFPICVQVSARNCTCSLRSVCGSFVSVCCQLPKWQCSAVGQCVVFSSPLNCVLVFGRPSWSCPCRSALPPQAAVPLSRHVHFPYILREELKNDRGASYPRGVTNTKLVTWVQMTHWHTRCRYPAIMQCPTTEFGTRNDVLSRPPLVILHPHIINTPFINL